MILFLSLKRHLQRFLMLRFVARRKLYCLWSNMRKTAKDETNLNNIEIFVAVKLNLWLD